MAPDAANGGPSNPTGGRLPAGGEPVLVPILDDRALSQSRAAATALAADEGRRLTFVRPVTIPSQAPLEYGASALSIERETAERSLQATLRADAPVAVDGTVAMGHDARSAVASTVGRQEVSTVVVEMASEGARIRQPVAERIAMTVDADAVVANGRGNLDDLASILVPVAAGPHSGFAVDVGAALANYHGAWLELMHVLPPSGDGNGDGEALLAAARERAATADVEVDARTLRAESVADALVEQSRYYDAVVLGAPSKGRLRRFVAGSTPGEVRDRAETPVLVAHRNRPRGWPPDGVK